MEVPGYSDLEEIGQRNFGKVYKGKAQNDGKWYAIKQLNLSPNEAFMIDNLINLQNPNHIVMIINPFFHQDRLCLVMDFFPLGNMNDFLLQQDENIIHTRPFMKQIADAVHFLHCEGILHGDLKPDNIMISEPAQNPIAKVADFGLAEASRNAIADIVNRRWYMAPELFSRIYTKESDVYSMGAMFAAMLDRTTVREVDDKLLLAVSIK